MKIQPDFEIYKHAVVSALIKNFDYSEKEAAYVTEGYRDVMLKIGLFENPSDWAIHLDSAMKSNITPDMWRLLLND